MTQEDQETLNEIFLGKEDPDLAFKPMTNNLKEDEEEKCTEKNCLYKKYLSKDVLALLQKHDVTMWRLGCENHHFGLEIGAKVFSEFLEEYSKTLINQKEKELLEKVHCGMCGSHFLVDSTPGPFGQNQEETINMQDVVNKQLKEELKGGQDE